METTTPSLGKSILIIGCAGYIGSALREYLSNYFSVVDGIDTEPKWEDHKFFPYRRRLSLERLAMNMSIANKYDYVILLAGLSSVQACINAGAARTFKENVGNFVPLSKYKGKLIYISSASVYGDTGLYPIAEHNQFSAPKNEYDWSKQLLEKTAEFIAPNSIGLRLGTVCGYSPSDKVRLDLMINKMVYHAHKYGKVSFNNAYCSRAILGMQDLCSAIKSIIDSEWIPGVYNLASFNATIGEIVRAFSFIWNTLDFYQMGNAADTNPLALIKEEDTSTYSFALNCEKFKNLYSWEPKEDLKSIIMECLKNPLPDDLTKHIRV